MATGFSSGASHYVADRPASIVKHEILNLSEPFRTDRNAITHQFPATSQVEFARGE
jgi:hypothetical protein